MPLILLTSEEYAEWLKNRPETPLWQCLEWKRYQERLGRETRIYGLISNQSSQQTSKPKNIFATALVIIDRTSFGLSTWDIPRGPTGNKESFAELIAGILEEAKKERCIALYYSPFYVIPNTKYVIPYTHLSSRHEQPEATLIINLTESDDQLLSSMHEKGRYNIRLAKRHGITVETSQDIDTFYALIRKTGKRDHYTAKPKSHYKDFIATLPGSFLLLAYDSLDTQKKALAGLIGVIYGETGIYYYGASDHAGRAKMAPSLLQFEAMKFCRSRGALHYDLFGIAPNDDPNHPWAGVTRFKKQFGGEQVMYPQEKEVTLMPIVKKLIEWKRKIIR